MTKRDRHDRERVLIFAARSTLAKGVTGAAIGTETVVDLLEEHFEFEWIELDTNGLSQLARSNSISILRSHILALWASILSLLRLIKRGLVGPRVSAVYILPASSLFGSVRDVLCITIIRLLFPSADLICHIRNGDYFLPRGRLSDLSRSFACSAASKVIVLSPRLLPRDGNVRVADEKIRVVPNTIDRDCYEAYATQNGKVLKRQSSVIKVLYMSNFIKEKGYIALLDAIEMLASQGVADRYSFTFYGAWLSSGDRSFGQVRQNELARQGVNIFMGDTIFDRQKVREIYRAHDVFCLPTQYAAEAQPRSILEAMANECAILATDYRAIPDQVLSGVNGVLLFDQRPENIAQALISLLDADLPKMTTASRRLFEERFSRRAIKNKLNEAFRN